MGAKYSGKLKSRSAAHPEVTKKSKSMGCVEIICIYRNKDNS